MTNCFQGETKKLNLLQNAKNKIFGKKTPDTSVVIENDNTYEEVSVYTIFNETGPAEWP